MGHYAIVIDYGCTMSINDEILYLYIYIYIYIDVCVSACARRCVCVKTCIFLPQPRHSLGLALVLDDIV